MRRFSAVLVVGALVIALAVSPAGAPLRRRVRSLAHAARRRRDERRIERDLHRYEGARLLSL
ncbi:MAG: hypothetical protein AB7I38_02105 [Dehalococcoidia bacterium]